MHTISVETQRYYTFNRAKDHVNTAGLGTGKPRSPCALLYCDIRLIVMIQTQICSVCEGLLYERCTESAESQQNNRSQGHAQNHHVLYVLLLLRSIIPLVIFKFLHHSLKI